MSSAEAEGRPFELLLCDDRLANGGSALDAGLRLSQRSGMRIPLLLITGETAPDRLQRVRQSGVAVLFKPVDSDRLPCAVEAALQDAREFPGFLKGRWTLPQGCGYRTASLFDAARVRARARASRWVAIASGLTNGPGPAQLLVGKAVSNGAGLRRPRCRWAGGENWLSARRDGGRPSESLICSRGSRAPLPCGATDEQRTGPSAG
jgi:CheY-like chemotaxis protein